MPLSPPSLSAGAYAGAVAVVAIRSVSPVSRLLLERLQVGDDVSDLLVRQPRLRHGLVGDRVALEGAERRHDHAGLHPSRVLDPERQVLRVVWVDATGNRRPGGDVGEVRPGDAD